MGAPMADQDLLLGEEIEAVIADPIVVLAAVEDIAGLPDPHRMATQADILDIIAGVSFLRMIMVE